MTTLPTAADVLDREFLEVRAKILQVAAALDRIDRASGDVQTDPRRQQIQRGLETLLASGDGRAEAIQLGFSRPYEQDWQQAFFPAE